jgi:hypothetical protein
VAVEAKFDEGGKEKNWIRQRWTRLIVLAEVGEETKHTGLVVEGFVEGGKGRKKSRQRSMRQSGRAEEVGEGRLHKVRGSCWCRLGR